MASNRPIKYYSTPMFVPESMELARVVQDGLKKYFEEATAEWVDCPDLTQEPFNFVASGLCGDAMLLEIGSKSNLFCQIPHMQMKYNFKEILNKYYNNYSNAFIIGAGFDLSQSTEQFGDLVMNASFSKVTKDYLVKNQSCVTYIDHSREMCVFESVTNSNPACYMHGNFFITEGKLGKVLKVYGKRSSRSSRIFLPDVLHQVLNEKYSSLNPTSTEVIDILLDTDISHMEVNLYVTGLGGTFVMRDGNHGLYSRNDQLKTPTNNNNLPYCRNLNSSVVAVGTIIINNNNYNNFLLSHGQKAYGLTEIHFKSFSFDEKTYDDLESCDTLEFLGYFYPAIYFHRIDAQSTLIKYYDS